MEKNSFAGARVFGAMSEQGIELEVFAERLDELRQIFRNDIVPHLHRRRVTELQQAVDRLFGKVDDVIREASLMATGRRLSPDRLAETARAGVAEIFGGEKKV